MSARDTLPHDAERYGWTITWHGTATHEYRRGDVGGLTVKVHYRRDGSVLRAYRYDDGYTKASPAVLTLLENDQRKARTVQQWLASVDVTGAPS